VAKKAVEKNLHTIDRMEVEWVTLDQLHANKYNPNKQNPEEKRLLKLSIVEDGFTQPVLVQQDGEIIDGFHRWSMMKELLGETGEDRFKEIAIVRTDMDDIQQRIATMRHNRARGNEDMELLSGVMRDLEALGGMAWASDSLQLDAEEIERLLAFGGTVLDAFPGDEPTTAWEPQPTVPGQVRDFSVDGGDEVQSVSAAAKEKAAVPPSSSVPGLGKHDPDYVQPEARLLRRLYVVTEQEAVIIDAVLGKEAAARLVEICTAINEGGKYEGVQTN
jgi:hypothetical protein